MNEIDVNRYRELFINTFDHNNDISFVCQSSHAKGYCLLIKSYVIKKLDFTKYFVDFYYYYYYNLIVKIFPNM